MAELGGASVLSKLSYLAHHAILRHRIFAWGSFDFIRKKKEIHLTC